eukprot:scaffold2317_cov160-Pinguiococcus_pyrenoidosus.AAC.1
MPLAPRRPSTILPSLKSPSRMTLSNANAPEIESRQKVVTALAGEEATTYTCLPSGVMAALFAPKRPATVLAPSRSPSSTKLPRASVPVFWLRENTASASLCSAAKYTCFPSGLTVILCAPSRAPVTSLARDSAPETRSRENTDTLSSR